MNLNRGLAYSKFFNRFYVVKRRQFFLNLGNIRIDFGNMLLGFG